MVRLSFYLLFAALCLGAQDKPQPPDEQPGLVFRTESNLAVVKFHVVRKGKYAEDVRPEEIELLEDGKPQKVALFEGPGQQGRRTLPVELILLFDVSLSVMNENLLDSYSIRDTVLDGLGGNAGVSVYGFGARLKRFTPPTNNVEQLKQALDGVYKFTHPGTRLYESVMQVAKEASERGGPNVTRVMVIFSDGESTTKEKPEKAAQVANAYGIALYPVVLGHDRAVQQAMNGGGGGYNGMGGGMSPGMGGRGAGGRGGGGGGGFGPPGGNPAQGMRMGRLRDKEAQMMEFASIGPPTGGRSFDPPMINTTIVKTILAALVGNVRCAYAAGYYPATTAEKKPHKLEVRLLNKDRGKLSGGVRTVIH